MPLDSGTTRSCVLAGGLLIAAAAAHTVQAANTSRWPALSQAPITVGFDHACGLTDAGQAYCWGRNDAGEIGDGTTDPRPEPAAVAGGHTFVSLSAGHNRTCGVTPENALYCWGQNGFGELGDGTVNAPKAEPTRVQGDVRFESVAVGSHHVCALSTEGRAYCWGRGAGGVLGDGATENRTAPTPVDTELRFAQIAAGLDHTCALTDAGEAYCWGKNDAGELGDGTHDDATTPRQVAGALAFDEIDVGHHRSCALADDGSAYCWGHNTLGTLGDGTSEVRLEPTAVAGEHTFTWLSSGTQHSCGVTDTGAALCWGHNGFGQVGEAGPTTRSAPARVTLAEGVTLRFVSAGGYHTCGVSAAGGTWCWGHDVRRPFGEEGAVIPPTAVVEQPLFRQRPLVGAAGR